MANDPPVQDCPPAIAKQLSWSRWIVGLTIALSLTLGFVLTHVTIKEFIGDVREIKQRVRRIEQKVDANTKALKQVEAIEGVDLEALDP